mgnify:CR=1 FL=1
MERTEPYRQELEEAFRAFVLKNFRPHSMSTEIGYFIGQGLRVTRSDTIYEHMLKIFEDEYINKQFQIPKF